MTPWHASYDLRLTAAGLVAAVAMKSVRLASGVEVEGTWELGLDTSG